MEPFVDAVLLVPGLLGFDRFASYSYFADRVATAIRVGLETHAGRPVLVAPLGTLPAAPLARRQKALFANIANIAKRHPSIERIHLVGHSTGGLDAYLTLCDTSLSGAFPAERDKIRSVVTIAAPLLGTCLVEHDAIRLLAGRLDAVRGSVALVNLVLSLRKQLSHNVTTDDVLAGFVADPKDGLRYAYELVRHRELILELAPASLERLRSTHPVVSDRVPVTCFATWTPVDTKRGTRHASLFTRLQAMTEASNVPPGPLVLSNVEELGRSRVFSAGPAVQIDAQSSDGIVNTARQVVPGARLGGVVVADHVDVIGQYNRANPADDKTIVYELLTSAAEFNDEVFFSLFAAVSHAIAAAIPPA